MVEDHECDLIGVIGRQATGDATCPHIPGRFKRPGLKRLLQCGRARVKWNYGGTGLVMPFLGRQAGAGEMKDIADGHESHKFSVNGHGLTKELLDDYSVRAATGPDAAETADREATRYLSAATQLNIEYAKMVVDRVVNEPLKALAPTFGVDVEVVAMWAMKALRTRAIRDYCLAGIFALQSLLIITVILWWPWAWVPVLLLLATALLVVSWEYRERIHNTVVARMLRDRFTPGQAPLPPRQADRERLREVAKRRDGNLAVFSGHSAFIGSGQLLYHRRILLDVSGRKESNEGQGKHPEQFSSHDLHAAIVKAFDRERGLGKSLDNIRAYERLFVNGLHIKNNKQLLPDVLQPPPTSVDGTLLRDAAVNPSPEARTYVCVEMPGWQGQLVVTLFIRAVYAGKSLYVDWTFRVLPPIRAEFLDIDGRYEFSRYHQLRDSLASGLRVLVPALFGSPVRALRSWRSPHTTKRRQSGLSYAIQRGYVFDYGARKSIREDASGSQRQHYFLARDETMYVLLAQQTLIRAVGDFLDERGVDLGQFNDQVKVIFEQSINYNIGNISGSSGIVIGDNSSATVGDSSKGRK